ncbi:MFS transporter [Acidicapsa ligni]|uniref:MFS transporter n=1 Tax=Acidicapsa ligni TaxID=542300 RepID=UPI0021E0AF90|nr:MFS transporter [Acidicapsa ligni]
MRLTARHKIFLLTWITYAGFYFCRKNISIVLPLLHGVSGLSSIDLANIIAGYSFFYAVGQFGFGFLSDRIGPKRVVGFGLLLVAGSNLLMGVRASLIWLLVFACLNGVGQSTGWSGLVKIMASWFGSRNRGVVMAWWGTNYVLGGFLATVFATWAVAQHMLLPGLGWRRGFVFPSLIVLAVAVLFFFGVDESPKEAGLPSAAEQDELAVPATRSGGRELKELLAKPQLWVVSISYFFLEMCRYALMFWLPFYMVDQLRYSLPTAGYVSSLYELVGIVGAVAAGYISDRLVQSRRAPVSVVMLFGLAVVMLAYPLFATYGKVGTAIVVILAGILSYGPDTLLSGAAAQDIGGEKAAASAAGIVDGIGHLGALFSPYLVVYISTRYGWNHLFMIFAVAAFLAGAILTPMWNLKPPVQKQAQFDDEVMQPVS